MGKRHRIIEEDLSIITQAILPWEELQGKRILITGATGFIGSYIVETLAYLNETKKTSPIKIYALARDMEKLSKRFSHLLSRADFVPVIQDVNIPWVPSEKIDFIIHAASEASSKAYLQVPVDTIKANTLGTMNLLELAKHNDSKLLFLSSGAVYGDSGEQEISETSYGVVDPLHTHSCYSESKRLGEAMCMAYWNQYDTSVTIARISHTYGPGLDLDDGRVFTDFIADVIAGRNISINSDGLGSRPFCYITDLIRGLFFILINGLSGNAYNVGVSEELSIMELAELIIRISGKKYLNIRRNKSGGEAVMRASGHFNANKLKQLGWDVLVSPETGFERMYRYYL